MDYYFEKAITFFLKKSLRSKITKISTFNLPHLFYRNRNQKSYFNGFCGNN